MMAGDVRGIIYLCKHDGLCFSTQQRKVTPSLICMDKILGPWFTDKMANYGDRHELLSYL